ncbi:glycosyltransferase [Photobacterium nomapromontoriensis]|uniref:glycosyltransferase n=1 Tax=Photobacterium nomapromontoriensis TaxID=2910237 RepID=UPI003D119C0E
MSLNIQICIFAYNLAPTIEKTITNLVESCAEYTPDIYVMINGCRDNTLSNVSKLAGKHPNIHPINIELGDKANAWNTFIYQYFYPSSLAIFVDGDLCFENNAIKNLIDYYLNNPQFSAVSSFPYLQGRSSRQWRHDLLSKHQFTGNLYLLSPRFIHKIIEKNVKLPVGLIGDDSMLGYLSATDLCSGTDLPKQRIGVCTNAVFIYDSLNPFSWQDCKLYLRRRLRYSLRYFQQRSIVKQLKRDGIQVMPDLAIEATTIPFNQIRWLSSNLIFDVLTKIANDWHHANVKRSKRQQ